MPLNNLPDLLQKIAPLFPTYHLAQMMYAALGAKARGTLAMHLLGISLFTVAMLLLTLYGYRRREQNA